MGLQDWGAHKGAWGSALRRYGGRGKGQKFRDGIIGIKERRSAQSQPSGVRREASCSGSGFKGPMGGTDHKISRCRLPIVKPAKSGCCSWGTIMKNQIDKYVGNEI